MKDSTLFMADQNGAEGPLRALASRLTRLALSAAIGREVAKNVSAFRVFRTRLREAFTGYQSPFVSIAVLLTWATSRFGGQLLISSRAILVLQITRSQTGSPRAYHDDWLQHRAITAREPDRV